jgi:hypothetical protein
MQKKILLKDNRGLQGKIRKKLLQNDIYRNIKNYGGQ